MNTIPKLAILLDPNHKEKTERVFHALVDVVRERSEVVEHLEVWVGDTDEVYRGVHKYLGMLKEAEIDIPKVIFPGHPFQVSENADFIMIADLLNADSNKIKIVLRIGKLYVKIRRIWPKIRRKPFPRDRKYGYLVLGPQSSVGRKIKARDLREDKDALDLIHKYNNDKWWGIYIEAGSGAEAGISVSNRTDLVRNLRSMTSKIILTGGGVSTAEEAKELWKAGSDIVVISSCLEKSEDPRKLIEGFLEALVEVGRE